MHHYEEGVHHCEGVVNHREEPLLHPLAARSEQLGPHSCMSW